MVTVGVPPQGTEPSSSDQNSNNTAKSTLKPQNSTSTTSKKTSLEQYSIHNLIRIEAMKQQSPISSIPQQQSSQKISLPSSQRNTQMTEETFGCQQKPLDEVYPLVSQSHQHTQATVPTSARTPSASISQQQTTNMAKKAVIGHQGSMTPVHNQGQVNQQTPLAMSPLQSILQAQQQQWKSFSTPSTTTTTPPPPPNAAAISFANQLSFQQQQQPLSNSQLYGNQFHLMNYFMTAKGSHSSSQPSEAAASPLGGIGLNPPQAVPNPTNINNDYKYPNMISNGSATISSVSSPKNLMISPIHGAGGSEIQTATYYQPQPPSLSSQSSSNNNNNNNSLSTSHGLSSCSPQMQLLGKRAQIKIPRYKPPIVIDTTISGNFSQKKSTPNSDLQTSSQSGRGGSGRTGSGVGGISSCSSSSGGNSNSQKNSSLSSCSSQYLAQMINEQGAGVGGSAKTAQNSCQNSTKNTTTPQYPLQPHPSSAGSVAERPNDKSQQQSKGKPKYFNFPQSPNRTILVSDYLKQKLGEEKFFKMKTLLENSQNPMKILEEHPNIVADVIGEENLELSKIFKYIITSQQQQYSQQIQVVSNNPIIQGAITPNSTNSHSMHLRHRSFQGFDHSAAAAAHTPTNFTPVGSGGGVSGANIASTSLQQQQQYLTMQQQFYINTLQQQQSNLESPQELRAALQEKENTHGGSIVSLSSPVIHQPNSSSSSSTPQNNSTGLVPLATVVEGEPISIDEYQYLETTPLFNESHKFSQKQIKNEIDKDLPTFPLNEHSTILVDQAFISGNQIQSQNDLPSLEELQHESSQIGQEEPETDSINKIQSSPSSNRHFVSILPEEAEGEDEEDTQQNQKKPKNDICFLEQKASDEDGNCDKSNNK